MDSQLFFEFFNAKRAIVPEQHSEPSLWIKEILFLKDFSSKPEHEIRRFHLRKGLNILWSKAQDSYKEELRQEGLGSGHAAGKTTFCRFIRYILGENNYGNKEIRRLIRHSFPHGYVIAEVYIDETPWLVCLPFGSKDKRFVYRGKTMGQLFERNLESDKWQDYIAALESVSTAKIPLKQLPSGKTLKWSHLLAMLSRDQEARYDNISHWRHKLSESTTPDLNMTERFLIIKATLSLISEQEERLHIQESQIIEQRGQLSKEISFLENELEQDAEELHRQIDEKEVPLVSQLFLESFEEKMQQLEQTMLEKLGDKNFSLEEMRLAYDKVSHYRFSLNDTRPSLVKYLTIQNVKRDLKRTQETFEKLEKTKRQYQRTLAQLEEIKDLLTHYKEQQKYEQVHLKEIYDDLVKNFLGPDFDGSLHFSPKNIKAKIEADGDRNSVAIETLKVLIFDLATLIYSIEGKGYHPRFLIHDSPREADLAPAIYQALFLSVMEMEKPFPKDQASFQYIVTTTEAPPKSAKKYIIDPILDANSPEGRLLGVDL